ncbi:MAG: amidase [Chloroflexi bacterium]|nr:amidase [Chloroflexota bacterium]
MPVRWEESHAFVASFELTPTGEGPLTGLTFAVKDVIDIAGWTTGCGNPTWAATHPPAVAHAVCVEQLLCAGATCVGKTVTDELAFSLLGQNAFFGTPLNPQAPDRVPGGSSSGSASAVACGLVDFALGTDTGGSVRVPASNCGVWGFRPSHGLISVAGVLPLAPTFDTVGVFASRGEVLLRVAGVLLAAPPEPAGEPNTLLLVKEAFALADSEVQQALAKPVQQLRAHLGSRVRELSLRDLAGDEAGASWSAWYQIYRVLSWAEVKSCLGAWIAATQPPFGPEITASFALVDQLDRCQVAEAIERRERFARQLHRLLGPRDLLCLPTTPTLAPRKGEQISRTRGGYYPRTLAQTSVAGIGRLPQLSLPVGRFAGVPVGLSLLAGPGQDLVLLSLAAQLAEPLLGDG